LGGTGHLPREDAGSEIRRILARIVEVEPAGDDIVLARAVEVMSAS
jgi:hypothetical protein